MKRLRVLVLMHPDLVPPDDLDGYSDDQINEWKTEYDIVTALDAMGHDVIKLGVYDELRPIQKTVEAKKPHVVFNLLEEFRGNVLFDHTVVAFLEAIGVPYTGSGPEGLLLGRGKALSKKILGYHRIPIPKFSVVGRGRSPKKPRGADYPFIVKSLVADASLGISQASVVADDERLRERVEFIHRSVETDAIVEEYIEGRDVYVGVLGNDRLQVFPPQELVFDSKAPGAPKIATAKVKHDVAYQEKWGIEVRTARGITAPVNKRIEQVCRRIFKALSLSGYARIDFRLREDGQPYFLEANPNPDLARYEEFANGAEVFGLSYEALLQRILNLGIRHAKSRSRV